jgi:hypothetical protein
MALSLRFQRLHASLPLKFKYGAELHSLESSLTKTHVHPLRASLLADLACSGSPLH